jgi:hypothetical protein
MKAWMLGSSRKPCARAIRRTSAAAPIGSAHKMLIQRRPMRMRGTIPSCGGNHSLMTIRSSAALRVDAIGSWDGRSILTESVISFVLLEGLSMRCPGLPLRVAPQEKTPQRDRVVMEFVVSREHERDRTLSCQGP